MLVVVDYIAPPPRPPKRGWNTQIGKHYLTHVGVMRLLFLYLIGMWFGEDQKANIL